MSSFFYKDGSLPRQADLLEQIEQMYSNSRLDFTTVRKDAEPGQYVLGEKTGSAPIDFSCCP